MSGTSLLSPHLRFGEFEPRQVAAAIGSMETGAGSDAFLRELGWREFAHRLPFYNPDMERESVRPAFDRMAWRDDPVGLKRWQCGRTGFPLVDAGMRELWTSGWMRNRARMVAASFLTKQPGADALPCNQPNMQCGQVSMTATHTSTGSGVRGRPPSKRMLALPAQGVGASS